MSTATLEVSSTQTLEAMMAASDMVPLKRIRTDGGTQARAQLDEATVAEYAETWQALSYQQNGLDKMPPIVVYYDGEDYWLADGFHRVEAYRRFLRDGSPSASPHALRADIRQGTRRDAVLYACGANASHGLRRTNADKRRAVETLLRDEEWRQWSDRKIADACAVSDKTVAAVRAELSAEIPQIQTRTVERNGTTYQMTPPAKPKTPEPEDWHWAQQTEGGTAHYWRSVNGVYWEARCGRTASKRPAFRKFIGAQCPACLAEIELSERKEAAIQADMANLIPLAAAHGFELRRVDEGFELLRNGERYSLTPDLGPLIDTLITFEQGAKRRAAAPEKITTPPPIPHLPSDWSKQQQRARGVELFLEMDMYGRFALVDMQGNGLRDASYEAVLAQLTDEEQKATIPTPRRLNLPLELQQRLVSAGAAIFGDGAVLPPRGVDEEQAVLSAEEAEAALARWAALARPAREAGVAHDTATAIAQTEHLLGLLRANNWAGAQHTCRLLCKTMGIEATA